ncbi:MAG TPA: hypothetical protein VGA75_03955, partial [Paracoccaceae bacterium]
RIKAADRPASGFVIAYFLGAFRPIFSHPPQSRRGAHIAMVEQGPLWKNKEATLTQWCPCPFSQAFTT